MKKLLVLLLGMMPFAGSFAQTDGGKQNAFKINILSPVARTASLFYERKVSDKSSAQLGFAYTGYNRDGVKINGVVLTPEYRFYLSNEKQAIEGFYVAPYLRYQNLKVEDDFDSKATLNSFGGGLVAGHQWLFSDIVTLDVFLGPNYNSGKVKVTAGDDVDIPESFNGFGLRFGVTLGIAF